jgi:hypothetical protein
MTEHKEEPKIIVDDDWKTKAQEEKEQLQRAAEEKAAQQGAAPDPEADQQGAGLDHQADQPESAGDGSPQPEMPLPAASFSFLVTTIATQAMAMLGQIPMPDGKQVLMLDYAKHHIDTLAILQEKTKGNLEAGEMVMLNNVLHDLRMAFVAAQQQPAKSTPAE